MRKFTYLLVAIVLTLLSATRVNAQGILDFGVTPLIADSTMLSSECSDSQEGKSLKALIDNDINTFWHTDWHGTVPGNYHYLDITFAEPISGEFVLYMQRRAADGNHPTVIALEGKSAVEEEWALIDTLKVPFNGHSKHELSNVWKLENPTTHFRLTVYDCAPSFNKFWHASEINIFKADDAGLVAFLFGNITDQFGDYLYGEDLNIGTEPDQYSNAEAYAEFKKELQYASDYVSGTISDVITVAQAQALVARVRANYQAVIDSRVQPKPYAIESGYYRIVAAMEYTATENIPVIDPSTGEQMINPDTDEPMVEQVTTHPIKAMYTDGANLKWNTLDEADCNYLFRLEATDIIGKYLFSSCATNGRLNTIATSTDVTMDPALDPVESAIALSYYKKDDTNNRDVLAISRFDQNSGSLYLHQGGHSGGAGANGNIVGWSVTGASQWALIRVADAEAEEMIEEWNAIHNREQMLQDVARMKNDGRLAMKIAAEYVTTLDKENPLIAEPTQFSSPYTVTDGQCETVEEVYPYLLDGDPATYWHSNWAGGDVPAGTHYLQVELTDPSALQTIAFEMTRRAAAGNDHVTEWGVFGTNDPEAEKSACKDLDIVTTPFKAADETIASQAFEVKGYKYIRFYINNTVGSSISATRGYGHASEFQLYPATNSASPNSQMAQMGEVFDVLKKAIEAVPTNEEEITPEHYTALKNAYDAFMDKYVDPAELRAKILAARPHLDVVVYGDKPGYWAEGAASELQDLIKTAEAYDESGAYSSEKTTELITRLDEQIRALYEKAHTISTDKWYHIHLASEEMYDERQWEKSRFTDENSGLGNLFSQYLTVGVHENPEGDGPDQTITPLNGLEVREQAKMHFTEPTGDDGSMFRFISVGDTAYAIQNKATSLYINCPSSRNVTLSLLPSFFHVKAVGYGQLVFTAVSLTGTVHNNLHVQRDNHVLVTWETNDAGSNSAMFVEEVEDVDFNSLTNEFIRDVRPGKIDAFCYPVPVGVTEKGLYEVAGTYKQDNKYYVALNSINTAKAGQPAIYINGALTDWVKPTEGEDVVTVPALFTVGHEIVSEADTINGNGLCGTFVTRYVPKGTPIFVDNRAEAADGADGTECTRKVYPNKAYLQFGVTDINPEGNYDLVIEIQGDVTTETSIQDALDNVAKVGNVYDMSGRLVRSNATLNDVKALGRGMYIFNGTKIMVK